MPKINNITNIVVTQGLTSASFVRSLSTVNINPDICNVSQINYLSVAGDASGVYLIYCDLIQGFIGSFTIVTGSVNAINLTPMKTLYMGNKDNFADVSFTLYIVSAGNAIPIQANALTGILSISLDFISYHK
jgi:hypothetical protein